MLQPSIEKKAMEQRLALEKQLNADPEYHGSITSLIMVPSDQDLCAYLPTHFVVQEFVPPQTYALFGARSWLSMDVRMVWTADAIREYFGKPVTINTWHAGGRFNSRGYRLPDPKKLDDLTQHKFGRAIDFDVKGVSAEEVRQEILTHPSEYYFRFIRRLELNVNWVHVDCAITNMEKIITFNP